MAKEGKKLDIKHGVSEQTNLSKEKPRTHQDTNAGIPHQLKDNSMSTDRGKFTCRE